MSTLGEQGSNHQHIFSKHTKINKRRWCLGLGWETARDTRQSGRFQCSLSTHDTPYMKFMLTAQPATDQPFPATHLKTSHTISHH